MTLRSITPALALSMALSACAPQAVQYADLDQGLVAAVASTADAAIPPASTGYAHDPSRYAQLIVRISYGGGAAARAVTACPESGMGIANWDDVLTGHQRISAGFTVVTPDNQSLTLEPMTVTSISRYWGLGGRDCKTEFYEAEYRSPLYAIQAVEGRRFQVKTTVHRRAKPTDQVIELVRSGAQLLLMTQSTTAPMAKAIADRAAQDLQATGDDLSRTAGADIYLDRTTPIDAFRYSLTIGDRSVPVNIEVRLINQASLFLGGTAFADNPSPPDPIRVLQTPFKPRLEDSPQTVEGYFGEAQSAAVQQLSSATTPQTLQSACVNLDSALGSSGLSRVDQAIARWALVSRRSGLAPAVRDQIACLRTDEALLRRAGIALTPPVEDQPPITPVRPSTMGEMLVAVAPSGDSDNLVRFFKLNSDHGALADELFAYPLALEDPGSVLMPADRRPVAHADSWVAHAVARDRPFFSNFGCYTYGQTPGVWLAKARAPGPNPVDYAVKLNFQTGADGKVRIHGISLTALEATPEAFSCH